MPAPAALATARVLHQRRAALGLGAGGMGLAPLMAMTLMVVVTGGAPAPAEVASALRIPAGALDAYQRAAHSPLGTDCGLRWQVVAGVARVESNHGAGRAIGPDGTVSPPIVGPALDGTQGTARVGDTDGGHLDGDTTWDHALGPLQFLPTSWQRFGGDANGDGTADPHNLYDAAVAAAAHLCAGAGAPLSNEAALAAALYRYNHSDHYVASVLGWIHYYDRAALDGLAGLVAPSGTIVSVDGILVDQSVAADLDALLAAAQAEGLVLGGAGWRSAEQQVALRRAHCGPSHYAIWEMPAGGCAPPTARPGQSLHEVGLAIDFTCDGALVAAGDRCFAWLAANAAAFGLHNLASEPWHWSTSGQ